MKPLNFNGRKAAIALKATILVFLVAICSGEASAQNSAETISPADKEIFEKLDNMMWGEGRGEKVELVDSDEVYIIGVRDIYNRDTGKRLGDAVFVQYLHPENQTKYEQLKSEGRDPNPTDYPVEEIYMLPIDVITGDVNVATYYWGFSLITGIEGTFYFYKYERYPEPFCEIQLECLVKTEDVKRYFNFEKDGWQSFQYGNDRCGMTKLIPATRENALLVVKYLQKNYPSKK